MKSSAVRRPPAPAAAVEWIDRIGVLLP